MRDKKYLEVKRMVKFSLQTNAKGDLTPNHVRTGNQIIKDLYRVPVLCGVCGSLEVKDGAIWEDTTEKSHIVCRDCHLSLRKQYHILRLPERTVFEYDVASA